MIHVVLVIFWILSGVTAALIAAYAGILTPKNPRRFIIGSIWLGPISLMLVLMKIWSSQ